MSLVLDAVSRSFGGVQAVAAFSAEVPRGRITGLIGPNGAGKTTVVNLITGLLKPSAGTIAFEGRVITTYPPYLVARLGIARTFQNIRLLAEATVLDNVVIGMHRHERTGIWANLIGAPAVWREKGEFRARALALLDRFGMLSYAHVSAGALSYGHQRRVEIMRALASEPALLLLDEPVAGMNDNEAAELGRTFRALADSGIGVILVEHNMRLVMTVCDYVYVLVTGKLIAQGGPKQIQSDPAVIAAYLGT